eukprot:Polyplicarium_translucidae@DN3301_c0_g1_i23.p3
MLRKEKHEEHSHDWTYEQHGEDWSGVCAKAPLKRQSPIALNDADAPDTGPPVTVRYDVEGEFEHTIENNGHSIQITPPDKYGSVTVGSEAYNVAQFHFHSPAEHMWPSDGENSRRPLELHVVHSSETDPARLAVLGVTFAGGEESEEAHDFFSFLNITKLPLQTGESNTFKSHSLLRRLVKPQEEILAYNGSLTTPPCTESVAWLVRNFPAKTPDNILKEFAGLFQAGGKEGNYRVIQNMPNGSPGNNNDQAVQKVAATVILS